MNTLDSGEIVPQINTSVFRAIYLGIPSSDCKALESTKKLFSIFTKDNKCGTLRKNGKGEFL